MGLKIYLFIAQYIIFCHQCFFIYGQNSRNAREGEFQFVVSISKTSNYNAPEKNHVCAGVLISNKDVLTLEFCSRFVAVGPTVILVGTNNLRSSSIYYPFWWMTYRRWADIKHEKIRFPHNELAIIRLTEPVSTTIKPAVCGSTENPQLYGSHVITAGWGELRSGLSPIIKQTATLQVLTNSECQLKIDRLLDKNAFEVHDDYLCTTDENIENWHLTDFGGPLLYDGALIGINQDSHPLPSNRPHSDKINIHIRLDNYREFIMDVKDNF